MDNEYAFALFFAQRWRDFTIKFPMSFDLILYSKPGCHLCEGLLEKLGEIAQKDVSMTIEVRDITTHEAWFAAYQYEIPVLFWRDTQGEEHAIARPSPRLSSAQLEQWLTKAIASI